MIQSFTDGRIDTNKLNSGIQDFLGKSQHIGNPDKALSNNLYGIDHQGTKGLIPMNKDNYGYVFFTRPQLNLSDPSLLNLINLYSFGNSRAKSLHRYIRCMLDPRLHLRSKGKITSLLVDHDNAFIPILTNNIVSCSGWPDTVAQTYTSRPGVRKQEWVMIDSNIDLPGRFDLDVSFRNTAEEPIIQLFRVWVTYASAVYENITSPYLDYIIGNVIDYQTRVYRLILDETKRKVKKISIAGTAIPLVIPDGKMFDYTESEVYNLQNKTINFRLACTVAEYNIDKTIMEFNKSTGIFNAAIRSKIAGNGNGGLVKIPPELLPIVNHRGYPYINIDNDNELEWYIPSNSKTYKDMMSIIKK